MKTILIAGGTGLVGSALAAYLKSEGYSVRVLSRNPKSKDQFYWNPEQLEMDPAAMEGVDGIVNLAGAGIADERWTSKRKELIISSRVNSNLTLKKYVKNPSWFISAGAIGYYGHRGEDWLYEDAKPGVDFLSESCVEWEKSVKLIADTGIRTVILRIGIVLSGEGGAWPKLYNPFRLLRIAPFFGFNKIWYSWIHCRDLIKMIQFAVENEKLNGVCNAVSPHPITQKELMKAMIQFSKGLGMLIPVPKSFLKLILGEMGAVVLTSSKVSSKKIESLGFRFQYPTIEEAVRALIRV
jgi:uncharacterized protein